MPGIWNINNGYNVNTKKLSSKLTFEVGERFTGRVVAKGEGKDVTIKLSDGWQFIAELEGNVDLDTLKLIKFQVDGFENGKLKLKLVQGSTDGTVVEDEHFQDVIQKEGLSKEDIEVLKKMIKHNISLTRENINEIKGLIQFNEKMNSNSEEIDAFINKYLQSKGIDGASEQGAAIKETLTKFFNAFKNMSSEDIITFIENKLDFTKENIESFNRLFKGDSTTIEKLLMKISNSLNDLDITGENFLKNNINISKEQLSSKEAELNTTVAENNNTALASKLYNANDFSNKKLNVLDILKTIAGNNETELKKSNQDGTQVKNDISTSLMEKLEDKELVKLLKDTINEDGKGNNLSKSQASGIIEVANKSKLEQILSKVEGKEVKLTDGEFKKITDLLSNKSQAEEQLRQNVLDDKLNAQTKVSIDAKQTTSFKEATGKMFTEELIKNNFDSKEEIKSQFKGRIEDIRDVVKGLINKTDIKEVEYNKVMGLIKENINDFKVFNTISDEYYYLNVPIKSENNEYPCKLIIKDNRKDGKKIDTSNAKMVVSVKTVNLGEVDGYLTMRDNKIDVTLKCDSEFTLILHKNKQKLADGLKTLGLFVNIHVSEKDRPVDIVNCRDFFNDLTISAIDIKV